MRATQQNLNRALQPSSALRAHTCLTWSTTLSTPQTVRRSKLGCTHASSTAGGQSRTTSGGPQAIFTGSSGTTSSSGVCGAQVQPTNGSGTISKRTAGTTWLWFTIRRRKPSTSSLTACSASPRRTTQCNKCAQQRPLGWVGGAAGSLMVSSGVLKCTTVLPMPKMLRMLTRTMSLWRTNR